MSLLRIFEAQTEQQYTAAQYFVMPYEQHCCSLMQRILAQEGNLYLIAEENKLCGVFYFVEGGILMPCLPHLSKNLAECLHDFFYDKYIFCITGKSDYVTFLNKLLTDDDNHDLIDTRFFYLMEHEYSIKYSLNPSYTIEPCRLQDSDALFPLHLSYLMEEVRNPIEQPNPVEERKSLKHIINSQYMLAIKRNGIPIAKAQTNAQGLNYVQIGGVYTQRQSRRQGLACQLVSEIADWAYKKNKKTVLFVNKYNASALHSYENAGFSIHDNFIISYFA